jgi:proton-dependent oligopeptide transporter, POT family
LECNFATRFATARQDAGATNKAPGAILSFSERFHEIRTGFERPFWIANISEIFERLSYYGAFASLALYLQERLNFSTEQTGTLTGIFGGMVWFLAIFGGAAADRLGFRRALSVAYLILAGAYFLIGSIGAPWLSPVRNAVPIGLFVGFILILPALGVSLVKPCVVGTTARASKENVRSIGYSIYYTMVNIGGAAGPYFASWAHRNLGVENVYRLAALSVFAMFFVVFFFFREPRKPGDAPPPSIATVARNFCVVVGNYRLVLPVLLVALLLRVVLWVYPSLGVPWWIWTVLLLLVLAGISRFMWFLVIFTGYWIVFWQQYISLPGYIHGYINPGADVEIILVTDGLTVICLTLVVNYLTRKIPAFQAVILGTVITSVSWLILAYRPTIVGAILSLFVLALGEIIQQPRYYEYISRLAPPGQQGTYMGFAFLPIGIGSLIGGWFGGTLMHHFGEVTHQPERIWWTVTAVGVATTALLWIYDKAFRTPNAAETK